MKIFLFESNLLPTAQFAYRAQHSTEDALVYAVNNLLHARDNEDVSGLVFVDLSKAFDCVQHQLLIHELSKIGVRKSALQWFVNYLSDRSQQAHIGECSGPKSVCSRGVPQAAYWDPYFSRFTSGHFLTPSTHPAYRLRMTFSPTAVRKIQTK